MRHLAICINHASGYTQSASTDGIRDNAAKCNQKIIDYLSDDSHAGPTGIVFMDFAGTDRSKSYDVKGLELVNTIINNNQRYTPAKKADNTGITLTQQERSAGTLRYDLQGRKVTQQHRQSLVIDSEKGTKAYIR